MKLITIILLSNLALANTLIENDGPLANFQDYKNPGKFLLQSETGNSLVDLVAEQFNSDLKVDSRCQGGNTELPPFVLAGDLFVNSQVTCFINKSFNTLEYLGETIPPKDNFAIAYLGESADKYFFMVNGRDYPKGTSGYIQLKVVNKDLKKQYFQKFIVKVPGLSGAMTLSKNADQLYYTMATGMNGNAIYEADTNKLIQLADAESVVDFNDIFTKKTNLFPGLSFRVFANSEYLFYDNNTIFGNYESYLVELASGKRTTSPFPKDCVLTGEFRDLWLLICKETELKILSL